MSFTLGPNAASPTLGRTLAWPTSPGRHWSISTSGIGVFSALNAPAKLFRCAENLDAEYIILPSRQSGLKLLAVYRNPSYVVYRLTNQRESSEGPPGWTSWPVPLACR